MMKIKEVLTVEEVKEMNKYLCSIYREPLKEITDKNDDRIVIEGIYGLLESLLNFTLNSNSFQELNLSFNTINFIVEGDSVYLQLANEEKHHYITNKMEKGDFKLVIEEYNKLKEDNVCLPKIIYDMRDIKSVIIDILNALAFIKCDNKERLVIFSKSVYDINSNKIISSDIDKYTKTPFTEKELEEILDEKGIYASIHVTERVNHIYLNFMRYLGEDCEEEPLVFRKNQIDINNEESNKLKELVKEFYEKYNGKDYVSKKEFIEIVIFYLMNYKFKKLNKKDDEKLVYDFETDSFI